MAHTVVCISSEDGAGGAAAAHLAARELGFRVLDEEIVTRAAVEAGVDKEVAVDVERRKSVLMRLLEGLGTSGVGTGYVPMPSAGPPATSSGA